jgi:hypothetical protein
MEDHHMKPIYILLLVAVVLLTACQSATAEPTPDVVEVEQPDEEVYPPPEPVAVEDPYPYLNSPADSDDPYPALQVPLVSNDPYAAPAEVGTPLSWEETKVLIMDGKVAEVTQLHSLQVTLVLKDGKVVYTVEPEIDAVFILLDECGEICKDVVRATE